MNPAEHRALRLMRRTERNTGEILAKQYKKIGLGKTRESAAKLRKIGGFSNEVIGRIVSSRKREGKL